MANRKLRSVCVVVANRRGAALLLLNGLDLAFASLKGCVVVRTDCVMLHRVREVVFHERRCGRVWCQRLVPCIEHLRFQNYFKLSKGRSFQNFKAKLMLVGE